MSTRRHRNSEKANEWAKKRAEAVKLAKQRRAERKRGQVNEEHTFKPQQISKPPSRESGNGVVSKTMDTQVFMIEMDEMFITIDKINLILFHKIYKHKMAILTIIILHLHSNNNGNLTASNNNILTSLVEGHNNSNNNHMVCNKTFIKNQKCQN